MQNMCRQTGTGWLHDPAWTVRLPVSADASWLTMKNGYTGHHPEMVGAGMTEEAYAPNGGYKKL